MVRRERAADKAAIYEINAAAFDTRAEANLVDALREQAEPFLSLVAEDAGRIIGHVAFSPVTLSNATALVAMGLGPMAVMPERQRQGVGSALVRAGLERCKDLEASAVVVLGHPEYYPRFGFSPASRFGLSCEYDVPDEAFMAIELEPGALAGGPSVVRYHPAFASV